MKYITRIIKVPLERKACAQCGKEFWGQKEKLYCARSCNRKARNARYYQAHREEITSQLRKSRAGQYKDKPAKKKGARKGLFLSER